MAAEGAGETTGVFSTRTAVSETVAALVSAATVPAAAGGFTALLRMA
jgi:hypothetical protein